MVIDVYFHSKLFILTQFNLMLGFYTPWKRQKTFGTLG